jgi:cell division protein FtsI/penicillin-binding protein 2
MGNLEKTKLIPIQKPVDGNNLVLTIDAEYQAILQDELSRSIVSTGASGGMGIILEPFSGKILAMTSLPDFDSNSPSLHRRNSSGIELLLTNMSQDQHLKLSRLWRLSILGKWD